jgi:hypothetical protein
MSTEPDVLHSYPNPFNPSTEIRFTLVEPSNVTLTLYDVLGRSVAELQNGFLYGGSHAVTWHAADRASGVYFVRFVVTNEAGGLLYSKTNKLVLMK